MAIIPAVWAIYAAGLAGRRKTLGVEIFPGFPAAEVLYNEDKGAVRGVATGDMGIARDGSHKPDYQPGMELLAKYTLFAEGARGHLTKQLKHNFSLEADCEPQVYGLGMKELWDIDPEKHVPGRVIHTQGWPLSESDSWGGGFLYHQANNQVALGFVVALDYANPHVFPFEEFQRWKQHPEIRAILEGGQARFLRRARNQRRRLAVGAEAGFPRRRTDRLFGGLCERAADQGQPYRNEIRYACGGKHRVAIAADREHDELV
jgi:electron-transferring-flavoprotein dehydrogenase